MGHLFLDIETYSAEASPESAYNPYLADSKVLLIAYSYYEGARPPAKEEVKQPVILAEWDSSEKAVLSRFLKFLKSAKKKDPELRVHGFNILNFDLPYLFGRMRHHDIEDEAVLHDLLFHTTGHDMMQLASLVSNNMRHKEQLWNLNRADVNSFFGIQFYEGSSGEFSRLYDSRKFQEIERKCREQFKFEQMLNAFYLYAERLEKGNE